MAGPQRRVLPWAGSDWLGETGRGFVWRSGLIGQDARGVGREVWAGPLALNERGLELGWGRSLIGNAKGGGAIRERA